MWLRKWLHNRDQVVFVPISPHSDGSGLQAIPWYWNWYSSRWHLRRSSLEKLQTTCCMRHDSRKFSAGHSCVMCEGSVRPPLLCLTRFDHCLLFKGWTPTPTNSRGCWCFLSIYHLLRVCQSKWDNLICTLAEQLRYEFSPTLSCSLTHRWR